MKEAQQGNRRRVQSMSSLLGRSKQGEKGRPDIVSRVKTVQIVLDSAGAAQLVRSRAPRGQSSNGNGNQATAGIDETLSVFSGR